MNITTSFYAPTRAAWRKWLEKNHAKAKEIWLVYDKKTHNRKRLAYKEALHEALCFGWIDGQGINQQQYAQRFTPRRTKSQWSIANVKHYKQLLKQDLISEHGKRAYEARHRIYDSKDSSVIYQIKSEFQKRADPKRTKLLQRFFKTGKGEYAEGDRFWGIMVPQTRTLAKQYANRVPLSRIAYFLTTGKHEERLFAIFVLVDHFRKADAETRSKIADFYLKHTKPINNWDLVDSSAPYILGQYVYENPKKREILYKLAKSKNLWERRIAIIATLYFIRESRFDETLKLARMLLQDSHDLIHKAVGWALREVGKEDERTLTIFLDKHASVMPRTMLRYAIERLSVAQRKKYLARYIGKARTLRVRAIHLRFEKERTWSGPSGDKFLPGSPE